MNRISRRSMLKLPLVFAMTQQTNLDLPPNLPRPKDDGGARHLKGMALPDLALPSTSGRMVNLSKVTALRIVIVKRGSSREMGNMPRGTRQRCRAIALTSSSNISPMSNWARRPSRPMTYTCGKPLRSLKIAA